MSDRLTYLCDKDLRTHTDPDLDDDVSELQKLALDEVRRLKIIIQMLSRGQVIEIEPQIDDAQT